MRADKFLWSVRLYKTRADAADACKGNRVLVNDAPIKASRELKVGDEIGVKRMPAIFRYRILELIGNRQPAKNIHLYIEDVTPAEELLKLEIAALDTSGKRDRGAGRPTKHERREIEQWLGDGES